MIEISLPSETPELTEEQKAQQAAEAETSKAVHNLVQQAYKQIKPILKKRTKNDLILNIAQLMSELQILRELIVKQKLANTEPKAE